MIPKSGCRFSDKIMLRKESRLSPILYGSHFLRGLANANATRARRAHGAVVKTGATHAQHSK
jgi:hypothetical protein